MNENYKYLNEERYQNTKKKITKISLIILIISIVVGGLLIGTGIFKTNSSKRDIEKTNKERYNEAYKESQKRVETANARLSEIKKEIEELQSQYDNKSQECDSMNTRDSDWYVKVNQCRREASSISSKISDLEMEKFELENSDYTVYYDIANARSYSFLVFIGIVIIAFGSIISLMFYIIAKRREIEAFTIQQSIPLAQEGIKKMTPSVSNAAESIAEGISRGINNGKNNQ